MAKHDDKSAAPVGQALARLVGLMGRLGFGQGTALPAGVDPAVIDEAEALTGLTWPIELKALLVCCDGGLVLPGEHRLMSVAQIVAGRGAIEQLAEAAEEDWGGSDEGEADPGARLKPVYIHDHLLTIATGGLWDGLYLDLAPGPAGQYGQVVEIVESVGMEWKASGLVAYITALADAMERGEVRYDAAMREWTGVDEALSQAGVA